MRKVVFISDPGIDGAFALALAMLDPDLDVLGVAATAGNVRSEQATLNVHTVIEQIDPPRWPRIGAALPIDYEIDGTAMHGPGGLGGIDFPCAKLHHQHAADKLVIDLVRQNPGEVTVVVLGPATALARAMDRDPDLPSLIKQVVLLGGTWKEPGNVTATAEFHFFCDPLAARQVLRSSVPITLVPLDAARQVVLSPTDLLDLPNPESRASKFLSQIVPPGLVATANLYGIEGFHLKDVLGVAALSVPGALSLRPTVADVETRGELTRGMSVFDTRKNATGRPNVDLVVSINVNPIREYLRSTLAHSG
jgi:inosine-uridine nucleoside N-ribohydrolase